MAKCFVSVATQKAPLLRGRMAAQHGLGAMRTWPMPRHAQPALPAMDEVAVLPASHPLAPYSSRRGTLKVNLLSVWRAMTPHTACRLMPVFTPKPVCSASAGLETASAVAVCAMVQHGLGIGHRQPLTARACAEPQLWCGRWRFHSVSGAHAAAATPLPGDWACPG